MRGIPKREYPGHANVKMYLDVIVRDRRGRLVYQSRQPSRSYVFNFVRALWAIMTGNLDRKAILVYDTSGAARWYPNLASDFYPLMQVNSGTNVVAFGLVFGSGTTPPATGDYDLEAPLGTDILEYGPTAVPSPGVVGNDMYFKISRTATNISGYPVTISEVGVKARFVNNANVTYYFLIIRDILDTAITVDPYQTITAEYTIIVSV